MPRTSVLQQLDTCRSSAGLRWQKQGQESLTRRWVVLRQKTRWKRFGSQEECMAAEGRLVARSVDPRTNSRLKG